MEENKVKISLWWLAGACLCIFIFRIPGLYQHVLDIDETVFSEFAKIIMQGGIPYVDAIDNKPPLTYYFFALNHLISGGKGLLFVHFTTIIWVCLTALAVYRITSGIIPKAAVPAVMIFAFLMHTYEPKFISTSGETLINLPLALSVLIYMYTDRIDLSSILKYLLSGILLGIAVMINYKAGAVAVVYVLYSLIAEPALNRNQTWDLFRRNIVKLAIVGFSSFIPVILIGLYFHSAGNLDQAFFWGFFYNFGYIKSGSGTFSIMKITVRVLLFVVLSLPVWIALAGYYMKKPESDLSGESRLNAKNLFVLIWLALSFYAVTLGGRGYGHYFVQLVPPLSIAGGIAYISVVRRKKIFWVWLVVPVVLLTAARIDFISAYEKVNYPNYKSQVSFEKVGDYIAEKTLPSEKIYAWGWATPVYYFSDRRCASGFLISDFVSGRIFGTGNKSSALRSTMGSEFMPHLLVTL